MRRDRKWFWRSGRVVKRVWLRPIYFTNPLRGFWRWLTGRAYFTQRPSFSFQTHPRSQSECYCLTGRISYFDANLFGIGFCGSYSADWTVRPCSCSKILWLCFPDGHEDDIEDAGGLAALQAEFPGVGPV